MPAPAPRTRARASRARSAHRTRRSARPRWVRTSVNAAVRAASLVFPVVGKVVRTEVRARVGRTCGRDEGLHLHRVLATVRCLDTRVDVDAPRAHLGDRERDVVRVEPTGEEDPQTLWHVVDEAPVEDITAAA